LPRHQISVARHPRQCVIDGLIVGNNIQMTNAVEDMNRGLCLAGKYTGISRTIH
jgi:hypothetical protein